MPLSVYDLQEKKSIRFTYPRGGGESVKIGKLFLLIPYKSLVTRVMFFDFNKPSEYIKSPIPSHHKRPNVKKYINGVHQVPQNILTKAQIDNQSVGAKIEEITLPENV